MVKKILPSAEHGLLAELVIYRKGKRYLMKEKANFEQYPSRTIT